MEYPLLNPKIGGHARRPDRNEYWTCTAYVMTHEPPYPADTTHRTCRCLQRPEGASRSSPSNATRRAPRGARRSPEAPARKLKRKTSPNKIPEMSRPGFDYDMGPSSYTEVPGWQGPAMRPLSGVVYRCTCTLGHGVPGFTLNCHLSPLWFLCPCQPGAGVGETRDGGGIVSHKWRWGRGDGVGGRGGWGGRGAWTATFDRCGFWARCIERPWWGNAWTPGGDSIPHVEMGTRGGVRGRGGWGVDRGHYEQTIRDGEERARCASRCASRCTVTSPSLSPLEELAHVVLQRSRNGGCRLELGTRGI